MLSVCKQCMGCLGCLDDVSTEVMLISVGLYCVLGTQYSRCCMHLANARVGMDFSINTLSRTEVSRTGKRLSHKMYTLYH